MVAFDFLTPILEFIAALLGFIYVLFIAKEKSSGWIFGILSATFYAFFFYRTQTWGLFSQQISYIILGFYGLITWSKSQKELPVHVLGKAIWKWVILSVIVGFFFLEFVMYFKYKIPEPSIWIPYAKVEMLDAQFFVFSLLATWLTTKKVLENWYIWIVINITGTIWFAMEHWWYSSFLYFGYLILAFNGLRKWKKALSA